MREKAIDIFNDAKKIWPLNLAFDIFERQEVVDPNALIAIVSSDLTERESEVIFKYYKDGLTLREISDGYALTQERIRQVKAKAIRKLRNPTRVKKYKIYSFDDIAELKSEIEKLKHESEEMHSIADYISEDQFKKWQKDNETIESLDLSVRSYNCLKRYAKSHYNQDTLLISQLLSMSVDELYSIRNMGKSSVKDITDKLYEHGYYKKVNAAPFVSPIFIEDYVDSLYSYLHSIGWALNPCSTSYYSYILMKGESSIAVKFQQNGNSSCYFSDFWQVPICELFNVTLFIALLKDPEQIKRLKGVK